jgi:peptidoglycan-N-acetylglucosamine deacetylase
MLCYNLRSMRRIFVLAVLLILALASLAFAQVERDPSSRHGTDESARISASAKPRPAAKAKPMLTVERAARLAGASITKAAQDVPVFLATELPAPAPGLEQPAADTQTDATAAPEANAAVAPEAEAETAPASNGTGRVEVQTSALLKDDPEAGGADGAAAQQPADTSQAQPSGSELAELARQRSAELEHAAEQTSEAQPQPEAPDSAAPAPAAETAAPSAEPAASGDAEAAPAPEPQPEVAAPAPTTAGKHLIPNRRAADEPLRSRDGSADPLERSVPQEGSETATVPPAPSQPASASAQPASTAPGERGTSLAQITGEPRPVLPPTAAASTAQPAAGFIAPAAGHSAPVTLALPLGQPHMPRYDVPASLKILRRGNPHEKLIALTFDDGPHPEYTSQLLAVLDYYDVKATFFCVGVQAQKYPQWVKMINQQGHEIANHTYDHFRLPKLPRSEKQYQIDENQRLIESLTGVTPRFMRPPGGQDDGETEQMLAQRKMVLAMWDVAINDTSSGRLEQDLLAVSLRKVRPGSVLLAHDGIQATIDMLPDLIEKLRGEGYRFVTLSELAADI